MLETGAPLLVENTPLVNSLETPRQIQDYLDSIPYSTENINRCVVRVLQEQVAHCLDGALFGAWAMSRLGYPPLLIDIQPDPGMDDDHILVVFRRDGGWGAVAKSNFTNLRYREPVHRSLRELVMSYFNDYFTLDGIRVLRYYTRPFDLSHFKPDWIASDQGADAVEKKVRSLRRIPLLTSAQIAHLDPVDRRTLECGFYGVDMNGVFYPSKP